MIKKSICAIALTLLTSAIFAQVQYRLHTRITICDTVETHTNCKDVFPVEVRDEQLDTIYGVAIVMPSINKSRNHRSRTIVASDVRLVQSAKVVSYSASPDDDLIVGVFADKNAICQIWSDRKQKWIDIDPDKLTFVQWSDPVSAKLAIAIIK